MKISNIAVTAIEERVLKKYRTVVVDGFIVNSSNDKILLQKRSAERRLFPNFWDAIGGHLDSGEGLLSCLTREIKEESTLDLIEVLTLVHEFEWDDDNSVVNLQFLCRAEGTPAAEVDKVSEIRWIAEKDLKSLDKQLTGQMKIGVEKAFTYLKKFE